MSGLLVSLTEDRSGRRKLDFLDDSCTQPVHPYFFRNPWKWIHNLSHNWGSVVAPLGILHDHDDQHILYSGQHNRTQQIRAQKSQRGGIAVGCQRRDQQFIGRSAE